MKLTSALIILLFVSGKVLPQGQIIVKLDNQQKRLAQVAKQNGLIKLSFSNESIDQILGQVELTSFTQAFPLAKEFKH